MPEPKALVDPVFINIEPDLIVIGKDVKYKLHRINFLCLSPYFNSLFRDQSQPDIDGYYRLNMEDVRPEALAQIVNYASYGKLDINEENVVDLLTTGDEYNIRAIVKSCQHFLQKALNYENSFEIYLLAYYYNCEELKESAKDYIQLHDHFIDMDRISIDTILDICSAQCQK